MIRLVSIFLAIGVYSSLQGQGPLQKKFEATFADSFCACLQKGPIELADTILYNKSERCIRGFFADKDEQSKQVVAEMEKAHPMTGTDYEKGRVMGTQMIQNTIEGLVNNCAAYRKALSQYKAIMIYQLRVTHESLMNTIAKIKDKKSSVTSPKDLATFYTLLGILYEFGDNKEEALNNYDEALKVYPSTAAKGMKALLLIEK